MTKDLLPGLHWGLKVSFLDYVSRMPDGQGTISPEVTPTEGNVMVCQPADGVAGPADADDFWPFRGDVRFAGHHGLLFVRIADPWITVRDGEAVMTVLDPYRADDPRLPLTRFTLSPLTVEGGRAWISTDVTLTAEGTALFNDVYRPGEPFEPLVIHQPASDDPSAHRGEES